MCLWKGSELQLAFFKTQDLSNETHMSLSGTYCDFSRVFSTVKKREKKEKELLIPFNDNYNFSITLYLFLPSKSPLEMTLI